MTREEAIKELTDLLPEEFLSEYTDAIKMAIKALEQEPCEDAISRRKLLKAIATLDKFGCDADSKLVRYTDHYVPYVRYHDVIDCIELAFPFTPQPKMGRWITWKEANNIIPSETRFECSVCHDAAYTLCNGLDLLSPYCPNCGAKMQEVRYGE